MSLRHAVVLSFVAALAGTAAAQKKGDPAPEINFERTWNFDQIHATSLTGLRGTAVLLVFWFHYRSTSEGPIGKLNALHDRLFDRGLAIVGITWGDEAEIEKFVKEHEVRFPQAIARYGEDSYKIKTIPYGILVDPAGNVAWRGELDALGDDKILPLLETARPANVAAGLEVVARLAADGKQGQAYLECKKLLDGGTLSPAAGDQAKQRIAAIDQGISKALEDAAAAEKAEDWHRAFVALRPYATGYDGVPNIADVVQRHAALLADAPKKRDIDAGEMFVAAEALAKNREYDEAFKAYKKCAAFARSSKAGQAAQAAATAIEKGGRLGFMRGCAACEGADKTCEFHRKNRRR